MFIEIAIGLLGMLIGAMLTHLYYDNRSAPESAPDKTEVGFDPMMQFHRQIQVECPEGHARVGELCDLPGSWICVERFKEAEVTAWLDEPDYDHEIGIDEHLPYDEEGTWIEVEIQNDCGYGCKIYQHNRTGRRVLAHNSSYGCKRSFNLIKE